MQLNLLIKIYRLIRLTFNTADIIKYYILDWILILVDSQKECKNEMFNTKHTKPHNTHLL